MIAFTSLIAFACNTKLFAMTLFFVPYSLFLDVPQNFFKKFLSVVLVDMCDQDRESFIRHTGKLLSLLPQISCF